MKLLLVAGARPNFMKIAPLIHLLQKQNRIEWKLVHTGQHYDYGMSQSFFKDFDLPKPHYFLNVGAGTHAQQTANVMLRFEKVCIKEKPDVVMVVGDVNSTMACAITAKKLNIRVAHVEAGLRSRDLSMPEEINRIVTDSISDFLFVTENDGIDNLVKEGKRKQDIFFVGNTMIDTLFYCLSKLKKQKNKYLPADKPYMVITLHRPSNVDSKEKLHEILSSFAYISRTMNLYFPIHPRTQKNIKRFGLNKIISESNIKCLPPLSYMEFLRIWKDSEAVFTDSGGIQEETTALGIPCFTIRENTERPITIQEGTNKLIGTSGKGIIKAYMDFNRGKKKHGRVPKFWDGKTAERIIRILK